MRKAALLNQKGLQRSPLWGGLHLCPELGIGRGQRRWCRHGCTLALSSAVAGHPTRTLGEEEQECRGRSPLSQNAVASHPTRTLGEEEQALSCGREVQQKVTDATDNSGICADHV